MPQSDELIERACFAWLRTLFPKRASDEEVRSRITDLDREHVGIIINAIKPALQPIDGEVERLLRNPQLPFDIALAVQNSHYVANGVKPLDHLDAFTEQYVKDARTSIETIVSALNRDRLS
jgi:hypothetical protein